MNNELIERFGLVSHQVSSPVPSTRRYDGLTGDSLEAIAWALPSGYSEVTAWRDGLWRAVWISARELTVLQYVEGDLTMLVFQDGDAFDHALGVMSNYYVSLEVGDPPYERRLLA